MHGVQPQNTGILKVSLLAYSVRYAAGKVDHLFADRNNGILPARVNEACGMSAVQLVKNIRIEAVLTDGCVLERQKS